MSETAAALYISQMTALRMIQNGVLPAQQLCKAASSARAAAAISDSIGIPPHLLLPAFDFRCQNISRLTTSDEQRMESRFNHEAREFAQIRRLQKP